MPKKASDIADKKERFHFRVNEATLDVAKKWYKEDNCTTINEFIEKAILFYGGYVASEHNQDYFSNIVVSTMKAVNKDMEMHLNAQLFKTAVEISTIKLLIATAFDLSETDTKELENKCIREVRKIHGVIDWEKAIECQKS
jgi:hypothetical protein